MFLPSILYEPTGPRGRVVTLACSITLHFISLFKKQSLSINCLLAIVLGHENTRKNPCQRGILNVGGNRKYRANHITTFKGNNVHKYKGLCPSFSCVYGYITKRCVCFLRAGPASYIYFVLSYAQIKGCVMID